MLPVKGITYEMGSVLTSQYIIPGGRRDYCGDMELNAAECLEAYGVWKGQEKCAKYLEDLTECKLNTIQQARSIVMNLERAKKIAKGEIALKDRFGKPYPWDSYISGSFLP